MRRNHKNIRTEFKYLLKDMQRGKINWAEITEKLKSYGFCQDFIGIDQILRTKIPARVLSRIGRAAKRAGGYVRLSDFYYTWGKKNGKTFFRYGSAASDYHLIEFVKIKRYTVTKTTVEVADYICETNLEGTQVGFSARAIHEAFSISSSSTISNEKFI
jgi:hypothetical protein